jgi:YD repeat-containing protein
MLLTPHLFRARAGRAKGGTAPTRPATIPASSDTCLVSLSHYNERGENETNTDPLGTVTWQGYDASGQLVKTIENYVVEP